MFLPQKEKVYSIRQARRELRKYLCRRRKKFLGKSRTKWQAAAALLYASSTSRTRTSFLNPTLKLRNYRKTSAHTIAVIYNPAADNMDALTKMFTLQGRTAVITGGTRGIGAAMALALAEAGADIILIQRDTSNKQTHDAVQALGRKCTIATADLADQASVSRIIPDLVKAGHNMDILLSCAGIQKRHPAHQFPDDDWNNVLQVNLTTVFVMCRDFGAYLLSKPDPPPGISRGSIINVASLLTYQGGITVPAYAASKGGIGQLTKALSNEWASKGINVNAIAPGYIDTEMNTALMQDTERQKSILARIPAGRWGLPEDFKGVVVFLASDASRYVNGEIINIDGGWMGR